MSEWKRAALRSPRGINVLDALQRAKETQKSGTQIEESIELYNTVITNLNNIFTNEQINYAYYQLGIIFKERGDFEKSLLHFKYCQQNQQNQQNHQFNSSFYIAFIYHRQRNFNEAIKYYQLFVNKLNIKNEDENFEGEIVEPKMNDKFKSYLHYNFALALKELLKSFSTQSKEYFQTLNNSIEQYQLCLRCDQKHSHGRIGLAGLYIKEERWKEAIETLEPQLTFEPNNPILHYNFAYSLHQITLLEYRKNNSSDKKENFNNELLLQENEKLTEYLNRSISAYQRSISLNSNFPEAQNNLAEAMRLKGDVNQSISYYKKSIDLITNSALEEEEDSSLPSAKKSIYFFNLAISQKQTHQYHQAIGNLKKAIIFDQNNALIYYQVGDCLYEIIERLPPSTKQTEFDGLTNEAISYLTKANAMSENNPLFSQKLSIVERIKNAKKQSSS